MAGKNTSIFGIYPSYTSVESGVDALKAASFRNEDISVLFPENVGSKDFAHEKGTKAPEGTAVGAGSGAVGGIAGALVGMGIPEYEAKRYEGRVKEGGILLSVHSDSSKWTKRAKEILERTGAQDISSAGEAGADYAKSDKPVPRAVTGGDLT